MGARRLASAGAGEGRGSEGGICTMFRKIAFTASGVNNFKLQACGRTHPHINIPFRAQLGLRYTTE